MRSATMLITSVLVKETDKIDRAKMVVVYGSAEQVAKHLEQVNLNFDNIIPDKEEQCKRLCTIANLLCLLINQEGLYQVSKSKLAEYLPCIVLDNFKIKGQILANYHLAQDHAFQNAVIQESFTNAQSTNYYDALKNALFNYLSLPTSAVDAVLKLKLE